MASSQLSKMCAPRGYGVSNEFMSESTLHFMSHAQSEASDTENPVASVAVADVTWRCKGMNIKSFERCGRIACAVSGEVSRRLNDLKVNCSAVSQSGASNRGSAVLTSSRASGSTRSRPRAISPNTEL